MGVKIGYDNKLIGATLTATSEATGFPKENAIDWMTWDFWKANAAGTVYLTADLGSAQSVDYMHVFSHDLHARLASIKTQWSTDNFAASINDAHTVISPTDGRPIFRSWAPVSAQYWRYEIISPTLASSLGVLMLGKMLEMSAVQIGFVPPLTQQADKFTNRSIGGQFLGRSVKSRSTDIKISFKSLTPSWVRANWVPFMDHAQFEPFCLSWDSVNFPNESAYCWIEKNMKQPNYPHINTYMDVSLQCKALVR